MKGVEPRHDELPVATTRTGRALRRFRVDQSLCIGCGLCETRAPENIELVGTTACVTLQPRTVVEEENCTEAAEYCPTGGLQART